jgi:hypothetical protein
MKPTLGRWSDAMSFSFRSATHRRGRVRLVE